jgi:hypothetical protein
MKHHLITVAILLVALAFYMLGYSSLGGVAFVIGGAFELWFGYGFFIVVKGLNTPEAFSVSSFSC